MIRFLSLLLVFALSTPTFAQVSIPKEVEPYNPIVASCDIPAAANTEIQVTWRMSSDAVKYETGKGDILHIWAPPGDHWIEATIASQVYRELLVLVPDAANPTDLSKAKSEKVKIALSFSINRYTENFKVKGAAPAPPPVVPVVPVTPVTPVDIPTAEMQALMAPVKAIVQKGDPAKAALWGSIWSDYLYGVRTVSPMKTNAAFKSSTKSFTNAAAAKAGLENAFPGWTAAMDAAFAARFGGDPDAPLDWNKAIEFVSATVWAHTSK